MDRGDPRDPPRRAPARPPRRHLPVPARRDVRGRPRPDRLRRAHRHDARPPRRLRDLLELRRGRPPLRASSGPTRWRRCASSTSSSGASSAPGATRPVRTRSSSSPTTARPRARRSSSETATASTSWSSARSAAARSPSSPAATSRRRWSATRSARRPGAPTKKRAKNDVSDREVVVLGSGNLGLVYLMEEQRRLTLEEIDERHPQLIAALREHPHVGWLLVRSSERGPLVLGATGERRLERRHGRGRGPARALLADRRRAPAAHRRLRARRRHHGRQLL